MIYMTVRKKLTLILRFSPLKGSIETPGISDIGWANSDIIISRREKEV